MTEYIDAKNSRDEQAEAAAAAATSAAISSGQQGRAAEIRSSEFAQGTVAVHSQKAQSNAAVARLQAPPASTVSKATDLQARLAKAQAPAAQTQTKSAGQTVAPPP